MEKLLIWLVVMVNTKILGWGMVRPEAKVCFEAKACVQVEVMETETERARGLSGKKFLPQDWGMWFVFESPQKLSFWMKDMEFGLDFIWLKDKRVVEITEKVAKPKNEAEERQIIAPKVAADGVVEVNAGWVEQHEVEVGDFLVY